MKKKIIIVGAGYSGILTAKQLEKKLKKQDVEICLIDKHPFHTMLTELHEVAAGRVKESGIRLELSKIFSGRKVKLILDTVQEIDFEKQTVRGEQESYDYDYIVLAAGSRPNYYGIEGANQYAYSLWSYEAAVKLKERFSQVFSEAHCIADEAKRRALLSFWVIGAGFSGVEMISELAEYIPILCKEYGISEKEVSLFLVDGLGRVIPNLSEKLSAKAEKKLRKMDIQVMLSNKVDSMGEDFICLNDGNEVKRYRAGTIIWTAGTQCEEITKKAEDRLTCCKGRIQVNEYLQSVASENVFVVGDNMFYIAPGEELPTPQMVENCEQSAHIAAHNLAVKICEKGKEKQYKPSFHGVLVSIGSKDGVAKISLNGHDMCLSGFLAIAAKHFINVTYFIQVLGFHKVASYLKEEIFTIRNKRSLVGGHFSNRTPSFLLVPLRVWVGIVWFIMGITGNDIFFQSFHTNLFQGISIAIGVLLISGLGTTIAGVISIILQIICMVGLKAGIENTWMLISTIAIMFGAGDIFGLDYYVKPYVKKWWMQIPFIQKWYLY